MAAWWQDPVTQAHGVNGEQGVDLGTPFHTQLTEILGGTVQRVECSLPWACEIDVATTLNGQPVIEGYLHVDDPYVKAGDVLSQGEIIGLSGGEITSLPGAQHVDSSAVSTGPHTEYDIWQGNSPWRNAIDPTSIVQAGPGVGGPSSSSSQSSGPSLNPIQDLYNLGFAIGQGTAKAADPLGSLSQQIGNTFSSLGNWIHDRAVPFAGANVIALAVAVVVILVVLGAGGGQSNGSPRILPVPV